MLIDEARRRALVRAKPLPGASLATYRALEARVAAGLDDWRIELVPPPLPLGVTIAVEDAAPDREALALIAWAALRADRAVVLTGPANAAEAAADVLRDAGAAVTVREGPAPLSAGWAQDAAQ